MSDLSQDLASPLAIDAYARAAELQTIYATACSDYGCELNDVQLKLLAQIAMQCFDGTERVFGELLELHSKVLTGRAYDFGGDSDA